MIATIQKSAAQRRMGWRIARWSAAAALVAAPAVAMQFSDEVRWTRFDFAVAAALLGSAGLGYELLSRRAENLAYRAGIALALLGILLLAWVVGAVGIIGSERNPANLMFGGVAAVALAGAVLGRFRAAGMARALLATACTQAVVAIVALAPGLAWPEPAAPREILGATGLFMAIWLAAFVLFARAGREDVRLA